jgi:carbonic anhydrase
MLSSCSRTETGSASDSDGHTAHWGYEADNGPDAWRSMNSAWALCAEYLNENPTVTIH